MKLNDVLDQLAEALKIPETEEEAIDYINKNHSMQAIIEEMAFRQVIINILVAANIITEKDFNDSVKYFKKVLTEGFAKELLSKLDEFKEQYPTDKDLDDDMLEDDDDFFDDMPDKKTFDA